MVLGWLIEDVMLGKLIEHVDAFKVRRKAGNRAGFADGAPSTAAYTSTAHVATNWLQTGYKLATNWLQTGCRRR